MAITSIVAVADGAGTVNIDDVQAFTFTPAGEYPAQVKHRLYVKKQPFPRTDPPTQVVPAVGGVWLSYGKYGDQPQQPPPFEPEEHALREFTFHADYVDGSWQVSGSEASLDVSISAGVMDNTPSGEPPEPDDPFAARVDVRALCIWTAEVTTLGLLAELRPYLSGPRYGLVRTIDAKSTWAPRTGVTPTNLAKTVNSRALGPSERRAVSPSAERYRCI